MVEWALLRWFHQLLQPYSAVRRWDDEINSNELPISVPTLFFRLSIKKWGRNEKEYCKDVLFLGPKSEEATPEDRTLALDLQDTLNAHLLECVGLAANMIGVKKRAIIIRMGSENLVLFNPVLLEKKPYQTEEGCLSLVGESADHSLWGDFSGLSRYELKAKQFICQAFRPRSVSMKWII